MIKEYITRQHYLDRVRPYIGKDIIKVITGQRRVGKSYFLFQIMDVITAADPEAQIIYINKELYEFDFIDNYKALLEYIKDRAEGKRIVMFLLMKFRISTSLKRPCEVSLPRAGMIFTAPGAMPGCFPGVGHLFKRSIHRDKGILFIL